MLFPTFVFCEFTLMKFKEKYICADCETGTGLKTIRKCEFLAYFYKSRHVFQLRMYLVNINNHLLPSRAISDGHGFEQHQPTYFLRPLTYCAQCTYLTALIEVYRPSRASRTARSACRLLSCTRQYCFVSQSRKTITSVPYWHALFGGGHCELYSYVV